MEVYTIFNIFLYYLIDIEEKKRRRLIYLTQQSEVYSLYMQGVRTINNKAAATEKKSQGRQRAGRMTEEEEDKQLLNTSTDDRGFTRLTSQVYIYLLFNFIFILFI